MKTTTDPKALRLNARLNADDYERLIAFARQTGCSLTDAIRAAVRALPITREEAPCDQPATSP